MEEPHATKVKRRSGSPKHPVRLQSVPSGEVIFEMTIIGFCGVSRRNRDPVASEELYERKRD